MKSAAILIPHFAFRNPLHFVYNNRRARPPDDAPLISPFEPFNVLFSLVSE